MRENCTACIFVKHSHKYVNDTVLPSTEKKHAYLFPISSLVGKYFNERTKESKSNLKEIFP